MGGDGAGWVRESEMLVERYNKGLLNVRESCSARFRSTKYGKIIEKSRRRRNRQQTYSS